MVVVNIRRIRNIQPVYSINVDELVDFLLVDQFVCRWENAIHMDSSTKKGCCVIWSPTNVPWR